VLRKPNTVNHYTLLFVRLYTIRDKTHYLANVSDHFLIPRR